MLKTITMKTKLTDIEQEIIEDYKNNSPKKVFTKMFANYTIEDHLYLSLMFRDSRNYERMEECLVFLDAFQLAIENDEHHYREDPDVWTFENSGIKYQALYNLTKLGDPKDNMDYYISIHGLLTDDLPAQVYDYLEYRCSQIINK